MGGEELQAERAALVALLRHVGTTKTTTHTALRARFTGGEMPTEILAEFGGDTLFDDTPEQIQAGFRDIEGWSSSGYPMLTFLDDAYPASLKAVHDHPLVLFATAPLRNRESGFAVVGTRRPSHQGATFARDLARELGKANFSVISGLARGVDTCALEAAVAIGARTVAVIGSGLQHSYPAENAQLQRTIGETGVVLSQFFPEARPARANFPVRNATMSAYSLGTIIVEAGETSGTRIQARAAIKHGRPLIMTKQVASQTKWAQGYIEAGFDISVVGSVEEALMAAGSIANRSQRFEAWVEELVSG